MICAVRLEIKGLSHLWPIKPMIVFKHSHTIFIIHNIFIFIILCSLDLALHCPHITLFL